MESSIFYSAGIRILLGGGKRFSELLSQVYFQELFHGSEIRFTELVTLVYSLKRLIIG